LRASGSRVFRQDTGEVLGSHPEIVFATFPKGGQRARGLSRLGSEGKVSAGGNGANQGVTFRRRREK